MYTFVLYIIILVHCCLKMCQVEKQELICQEVETVEKVLFKKQLCL